MLASDLVRHTGHTSLAARRQPSWSALMVGVVLFTLMLLVGLTSKPASAALPPVFANQAPDGQGLNITPGDLKFILKQIKIAEHHSATLTADNPCGTLVGAEPNQIPDQLTSYGLRTVDGSCNNLIPGRETFAAADQPFPRLSKRTFVDPEPAPSFPVPSQPTGYASKKGNVVDAKPRTISNLIVDQTSTNPSAVHAAGFPVRSQTPATEMPVTVPCTTDPDPLATPAVAGVPAGCTPQHETLFIPNVTTDVGLSPPYNSVFTFFGQFFDHGVDQTVKSGGAVFVPLKADDPLIAGKDHILGNADDLPPAQRFMVLTRAQNQPGSDGVLGDRSPAARTVPSVSTSSGSVTLSAAADSFRAVDVSRSISGPGIPAGARVNAVTADGSGATLSVAATASATIDVRISGPVTCTAATRPTCDGSADDVQDASNTDSPWVDQSQTYTSHSSHQVFLREYVSTAAGQDGILGDRAPTTAPTPTNGFPKACVSLNVPEGCNEGIDDGGPANTGALLGGLQADDPATPDVDESNGATGMATWASVKKQAAELLGLKLVDADATNIPMLAADPYGNFLPGPARGLPQYVTASGLVEGDRANPVPVPANAKHFDTPFLTDIAHNADPSPQDTDNNPATPPVTPVPDADHTTLADFTQQPAGTYDDELLDSHFCAGDGRVNENIALTAVHQVFHSEHDRLVEYIKGVLNADASGPDATASGAAALSQWQLPDGTWNGERLFQAARFVTEMEYQHLVFEEFGRKIQPAIRPFHVYQPDINPAIPAEFAHAVYRFGHSMLDDDVARSTERNTATGQTTTDDSVPLLTGFLNPPQYLKDNAGNPLNPEQAAGSIFLGSSDQTGNELDEFVTETLRNNLLGLPLDLPTINMTRAREAGVPPLNQLRRQIFADTSDGQLAPYTSWIDYGEHLKHPESLINFVAAYGKHPDITTATTLADKRAAATTIVKHAEDPVLNPAGPADADAFMNSTGVWVNDANDLTTTGVDDVDLWVGGLAENTNINGGLLGTTFNYVFQATLENLQDGDRLYYLNRTPGMNLRTQLEGNSFAEMIQRNTDGTHTLKADAFATADCRFELKNLDGTAAAFSGSAGPPVVAAQGSTVADDPKSDCDESKLLLRKPDGTIQYRQFNTVDPSGINGQSVYNGTPGVDRVTGGLDNDTFWGGEGNDRIEGNPGDDVALGGGGNDTITDLGGADTLKGGRGNDSIDAGPGDDIMMGGDGSDFINGGANDNEEFAGPGNDFIMAGQGADAVFGDSGDDWIQGGSGQDLLQGDHAAPFFDDPAESAPGNDVFVGQVGENDYDTEGGDDIMSQNAAIDRNAGAGGFDWAIHQYDTVGANDDLNINANLLGLPLPVVVNRDRWQETEGDSGSPFNDLIKGDDRIPSTVGGAGFTGCDALDQAGLDRISGLAGITPPLTTLRTDVVAASAAGECPLAGDTVWGEGNILLGAAGSDTIEGRGGDDVIDGDRELTVRISVRNAAGTEIGSTDLIEHQVRNRNTGALQFGGKTLQAAVAAGLVDPGNCVIVRAIRPAVEPAGAPPAVDTAVFTARIQDYNVEFLPAGAPFNRIRVTQTGPLAAGQRVSDGVDIVRNIEVLKFSDGVINVRTPAQPTQVVATGLTGGGATGSVSLTWTPAAANGSPAVTSQDVVVTPVGGTPLPATAATTGLGPNRSTLTVNGLTNGTAYTFQVRANNAVGSTLSDPSNAATPVGPPAPIALAPTTTRGNGQIKLDWIAPPSDGGSPITGYEVEYRIAGSGAPLATVLTGSTATTFTVTGLTNGTSYRFRVRAVNAVPPNTAAGYSPLTAAGGIAPGVVLNAPTIGTAVAGVAGGAVTATANWTNPGPNPANNGAFAQTGSTVRAFPVQADGVTPVPGGVTVTVTTAAAATSRQVTGADGLVSGTRYRFQVTAVNGVGDSTPSALSNAVIAQ